MKAPKLSKRKAAQIFRTAANYLDKYGWTQFRLGDKQSGFCAIGACAAAARDANIPSQFGMYSFRTGSLRIADTIRANTGVPYVCAFNDAEVANKKGVQHLLRLTANRLEHGGTLCLRTE